MGFDSLAQHQKAVDSKLSGEQWAVNPMEAGSIPAGSAKRLIVLETAVLRIDGTRSSILLSGSKVGSP